MRFVLRIIFENQFVSLLSNDRSSPRDHWRVQRAKDTADSTPDGLDEEWGLEGTTRNGVARKMNRGSNDSDSTV